jgi:hypothetical protein
LQHGNVARRTNVNNVVQRSNAVQRSNVTNA